MPDGVWYVGRPSHWGNPFDDADVYRRWLGDEGEIYWLYLSKERKWILDHIDELRGRDLACWCKPGYPYHADVLLELANKTK